MVERTFMHLMHFYAKKSVPLQSLNSSAFPNKKCYIMWFSKGREPIRNTVPRRTVEKKKTKA